MAEATPDFATNLERFKGLNKSAFITAFSGGIGKILVEELDKLKIFKRIVLIGRREYELSVGPEFEQKVIDFEKLDDYADVFKDIDVGFHCLGTNMSEVGKEMFIKVDHDYTLKIGEMSKAQGCKHLMIITAEGSKVDSFMIQFRIKGQVEEAAKKLDYDRLSIFRPAALEGGKKEAFKEKAPKILIKPFTALFPTVLTVPRASVAKAMIVDVISPYKEDYKVRIIPNKEIHRIAKEFVAKD